MRPDLRSPGCSPYQLNHCDAESDPHCEDFMERRDSCHHSLNLGGWLLPDVEHSHLCHLQVGSCDDPVAARSVGRRRLLAGKTRRHGGSVGKRWRLVVVFG